jgi:hypothetical protein
MKVNKFPLILAFLLASIIAYFFSTYHSNDSVLVIGIGAFLVLFITAASAMSISFDFQRTTTLTKTVSALFFVFFLVSQIVFTHTAFNFPTYILVNGCLLILFLLVIFSIVKSKH